MDPREAMRNGRRRWLVDDEQLGHEPVSTADYQTTGGVGLLVHLSGGATKAPSVGSFDDFTAVPGH